MLPIRDNLQPQRVPWVTYGLIVLNTLIFAYQLGLPDYALERLYMLYGIVPARLSDPSWAYWQGFPAGGWLTLLTSMFLHGGWLHYLANMWTLWLFGDDVEDRLGHGAFAALYLATGLAAGLGHTLLFAGSTVPTIGASGAISGVMGAFLVLFPLAKIDLVVPIFLFLTVIPIPAMLYLPFWFLSQLFSGTLALAAPGFAGIAFWAHIAGFIAGIGALQVLQPGSALQSVWQAPPREPRIVLRGPGFYVIER